MNIRFMTQPMPMPMPMPMLSLVWFKRDLRVHDHPALACAATLGRVLPVFVVEPDRWAQPDASGRHLAFLDECLQSLRADLAALGQPLILRAGEAVEVLARLHAKHGFAQIVSHEETGTIAERERDTRVARWLQDKGLRWLVLPQPLAGPVLAAPELAPVVEGTGALPGFRSLGLVEDRCAFRQSGGRVAAEQALDAFLGARAQGPARAPTMLAAERGGSRLSPYLAWGVLSARAVADAARAQPPGPALRGLLARLRQREVARGAPLVEVSAGSGDAALRTAWLAGETGLPFVDAVMRALKATGWSSDRGRSLLASVAVHHLGLNPLQTGHDLARLFTDYDPAIHWRELAVLAGGTVPPRVPDPVLSGQRQDPQGAFIRRWLPELARLPDAHLHAPWGWPTARHLLAGRYPEPVIDPASATRAARALIRSQSGAPRREKPPLLIEPGPFGRESAQMALDL